MSELINVRIKDTVDPDKWYSGRKGTVLSVVDGRDGTYEYNNTNRVSFIDKEDCEEVFQWNFPGAESEGWITKSEFSSALKIKPVEDGVNASFPDTKKPLMVRVKCHPDKDIEGEVFKVEKEHENSFVINIFMGGHLNRIVAIAKHDCEIVSPTKGDKITLSPRANFREITYKHKANKEVIKHAYFHQWGQVFVSRGESKMVETVAIVELMDGSIMSLDLFDYVITFK